MHKFANHQYFSMPKINTFSISCYIANSISQYKDILNDLFVYILFVLRYNFYIHNTIKQTTNAMGYGAEAELQDALVVVEGCRLKIIDTMTIKSADT